MKDILKILFLSVVLFFGANLCQAKNESITIVSDVHLSMDKKENNLTPSIKKLLQLTEQVNVDSSSSVIFLGDNVQSANRYDIAMFAKIIKKIKKPYYVTIGNKDIGKSKGISKKEYFRILNKYSSNKTKTSPTYKKQGDFIYIFLSGVNETFPMENGYYKASELAFLEQTLTKFEDKKVIIFQHFPIIPPKESENKQTIKTENYLDVISKHDNILAIISGHYQEEGMKEINGIKHISVGSLAKNGEYEQIKIYKNKDNSYTIMTKILNVN